MHNAVLVVINPARYPGEIISRVASMKSDNVIYLASEFTYDQLLPEIRRRKLDLERFFFIDCITRKSIPERESEANCLYLDGPGDITGIGVALTEVARLLAGQKVLVLDSISALMRHNDKDVLGNFLKSIVGHLRAERTRVAFFVMDGDFGCDVTRRILPLVQEVIR